MWMSGMLWILMHFVRLMERNVIAVMENADIFKWLVLALKSLHYIFYSSLCVALMRRYSNNMSYEKEEIAAVFQTLLCLRIL